MPKYLIDVNLPYYFSIWESDEFVYVRDIGETLSDEEIWKYAMKQNLTIISKDADFSNKIILHTHRRESFI